VKSKKADSNEFTTSVSRRFSDFEWLYSELINKYGGYIIPIIPEKYLLTKFNMESYDFSEKRRKNL
jgi:sorting nexin-1/2